MRTRGLRDGGVSSVMMDWDCQQIRGLRLRLGWSAAELSRRLGCSVELVLCWEKSEGRPDAEVFNQLSFLVAYVEQNALLLTQIPLAEAVMEREHLAQITNEMVAHFHKN